MLKTILIDAMDEDITLDCQINAFFKDINLKREQLIDIKYSTNFLTGDYNDTPCDSALIIYEE